MRGQRQKSRNVAVQMLDYVDKWTDPDPDYDGRQDNLTISVALLGIGWALIDIADAIRETKDARP